MANILKVKALNNEGITRFSTFISETRAIEEAGGKPLPPPNHLLTNPEFLDKADYNKEVDAGKVFSNRYELGAYLLDQLGPEILKTHFTDYGLWAWLSLLWFQQLRGRATQRHEHFIPFEWIKNPIELLNSTQSLGYRHSTRTALQLVAKFGENSRFFFSKRGVSSFGDASEQLLSRADLASSAKIQTLLFELYRDKSGFMKAKALDKPLKPALAKGSKKGYGGVRRLVKGVLPRVRFTHDIDVMTAKQVAAVCGEEFLSLVTKKKTPKN